MILTPKLSLPGRSCVQFPALAFCVVCNYDRIVGHLLSQELHSHIFERFSEHGIANRVVRVNGKYDAPNLQAFATGPISCVCIPGHGKRGNEA
jgi:hypothetical protein